MRRDQPPQLAKAKPFQGEKADVAMPLVGGIEGAAEKADAGLDLRDITPPRRALWKARAQGRTWPEPRTTYL